MKYENLWGVENNSELENLSFTDNIVNIMRDQCQYLKRITDNKVFAKFARIKMISPLSSSVSFQALTEFSKALSMYSPREVIGDDIDTAQLIDANVLYDESTAIKESLLVSYINECISNRHSIVALDPGGKLLRQSEKILSDNNYFLRGLL